jgi:hypothetical protein
MSKGNAEDSHYRVPDELLQRAAESLHHGAHAIEVRRLDVSQRLGVEALPQTRRADVIAEQRGDELALLHMVREPSIAFRDKRWRPLREACEPNQVDGSVLLARERAVADLVRVERVRSSPSPRASSFRPVSRGRGLETMAGNDAEKKIDRLYALPLEEFTGARNELARELRKAGEREAADRVKGLRKPTVAAWLVNQLARREKMNVRALLTAGERLRQVHADVLRGKSPTKVEEARGAERRVIEALAQSAAKILKEQRGRSPDSLLDDVRDTLHAAAVDPALAEQLSSGRLLHEAQAAGFGFETALPPGQRSPGSRSRGAGGAEEIRRRVAGEKKLDEARTRVREARQRVDASEAEAKRARTELEQAERTASRERDALTRAEEALRKAEGRFVR